MRLLIADKLHPRAIEELAHAAPRGRLRARADEGEPREAAAGRRHPGRAVDRGHATAIDSAKELNLIVRAGRRASTRSTSAPRASAASTSPTVPGKNASAVAELVFGLMVALDRRIPDAVASLRAGKWERQEYGKAEGLTRQDAGRRRARRHRARGRASRAGIRAQRASAGAARLTPARAAELGVGHAASHRGARVARATSSRCTWR